MYDRFDWAELGQRVIVRTAQENQLLTKQLSKHSRLDCVKTVTVAQGIVVYCAPDKMQIILEALLDRDAEQPFHRYTSDSLYEISLADTLELAPEQLTTPELLTHWSKLVRRIKVF